MILREVFLDLQILDHLDISHMKIVLIVKAGITVSYNIQCILLKR